jgi:hypothetical protein
VRVFAVWQPMLATDRFAPTSPVLNHLTDSRVQQYWDPDHVLAKQMEADAREPQPVQECCVRMGILWDLAAVYPKGPVWSDRLPAAVVFNGPVVDVTAAIEEVLVVDATHVDESPSVLRQTGGVTPAGTARRGPRRLRPMRGTRGFPGRGPAELRSGQISPRISHLAAELITLLHAPTLRIRLGHRVAPGVLVPVHRPGRGC